MKRTVDAGINRERWYRMENPEMTHDESGMM